MGLSRKARDSVKQVWQKAFELGQRLGVNITPNHFYSDIPDFRELRSETWWRRPFSLVGVRGADPDPQWQFVRDCCDPVRDRLARRDIHKLACEANGEAGYGTGDAAFLYAFIRRHRPPRIVQIGCGVSTAVIDLAAKETGYTPEIVCVEPYPTAYLKRAAAAGTIRLIPEKAQRVDLPVLTNLGPGGMLFVDSTHTLRPGSEVTRIILEALPRLPAGAWAHFHDITLPHDYHPRMLWKFALFFPHETPLLHAFLCGNDRFEIAASLALLNNLDAARLAEELADYQPARIRSGLYESDGDFASAIYLRTRA